MPFWNLIKKYGVIVFMSPHSLDQDDWLVIDRLVEEGKRINKNPWCCSFTYETCANNILSAIYGIRSFPQETMDETRARRYREELNLNG